jgi:hypothetical protein
VSLAAAHLQRLPDPEARAGEDNANSRSRVNTATVAAVVFIRRAMRPVFIAPGPPGPLPRGKAGVLPSPSTAPVEANSSEPLDAFMLLDAAVASGTTADEDAQSHTVPGSQRRGTVYVLSGNESELATHTGVRVEIVGSLMPTIRPSVPNGSASVADNTRRIRVDSVKKIAGRCSATKDRP